MGPAAARTVLVTGAARRIGAAVAAYLAGAGHRVVLHYRSAEAEARALERQLLANGGFACVVQADLAQNGGAARLVAEAASAAGCVIDGLVNNASLFDYDAPAAPNPAQLDAAIKTNLLAPIALTNALAGQAGLSRGSVVNLLDQKVANLNPDFFSYTLSKLALEGATTMLAQAHAPRVRVNAVSPGLSFVSHDQSQVEFRAVSCENLLRRPVDPHDIARAVAMLLENESITGQNIFVDCGQRFLTRSRDVMFATRSEPVG